MQHLIGKWIQSGSQLKQGLETWAVTLNSHNTQGLTNLYSPKARLFPTFGTLRLGAEQIQEYFSQAKINRVELHYGSLVYHPDERMVEGDYIFEMTNGETLTASFAFKFNTNGKIVEHASAPKNLDRWRVRNEVCICTLLTAATVQSILKRTQALEAVA